eukprot:3836506-Rhodomonas_salina.2
MLLRAVRYSHSVCPCAPTRCAVPRQCMLLRAVVPSYALCGPEIGYVPMRCAVLSSGMLLPGLSRCQRPYCGRSAPTSLFPTPLCPYRPSSLCLPMPRPPYAPICL